MKEGLIFGALSGAAVAALFVGLIGWLQIQKNYDFATATGAALMAALDDINALQQKCGEHCSEVPLRVKDEMSAGYWNKN
ncbi:hypothetical protein EDB94_0261 [Marinobacter sp. 3-2]|jgi:hypothetical protein|uniref:hypothetical protein n=1 Tax=Marinobacter sp. 3-2 TaxID=2485141 RepID=UPI000D33C980|nr:hypothetical protein [Marinobacter sp. 3-2]ROQ48627.1 hypothetical protein EDB94_0261 [Marinobacter sp. 3-2]